MGGGGGGLQLIVSIKPKNVVLYKVKSSHTPFRICKMVIILPK